MQNLLKSWRTTLIGLVIIGGLVYNIFWNGAVVSFESALSILIAIGFVASKDGAASHSDDLMASTGGNSDPNKEEK